MTDWRRRLRKKNLTQCPGLVDHYMERVRDDWFEFVLIDEPENIHAVDDAISLFEDGEPLSAGVSEEARIALQRDESYIQSIVAAQKLRSTARPALDAQAHAEMEQLFLDLR